MTGSVESSYYYDYFGTVYSAEGEILDSFAFTAPVFITSRDLSFTQDGKKMLCGSSVFDLQTHELMDYKLGIDVLDIEEMRFVLDDQYLMIHSEHNGAQYRFVRLSDGETVFSYKIKEGEYAAGFTHLTEDPGQSRLYLYNSDSLMTGVCIDSESWEPLFEIPSMCCALSNDTLITNECIPGGREYLQYPLYTLEDMIRMGKELLGE